MKRFSLILALSGLGCLLVYILVKISGFDAMRLQSTFAADGSFDGPASSAVKGLDPGLVLASLTLLALAAFFYLISRLASGPFQWSTGKFVLAVIALKLILGMTYIFSTPYEPFSDDLWFYNAAVDLSRNVDPQIGGKPTALWPIGYSMFLAFFFRFLGTGFWVGQVANLLLLVGMAILTYLLGRALFTEIVARSATLMITLMPSQIFFALPLMSDVLFAFLVLILIYQSTRKLTLVNALLSGVIFGFAILVKPVVLFFPLGLATYMIYRDRQWKTVVRYMLALYLIGVVVLIPWQIRMQRDYHRFVLVSTLSGYNIYIGNNAIASGGVMENHELMSKATMDSLSTLDEATCDQVWLQKGLSWIKAHPFRCAALWPKKVISLFYEDSKCVSRSLHLSYEEIPAMLVTAMIFTTEGFYYSLGLAFLISLYLLIKKERVTARLWLITGTFLYFIVIYLPFIGDGRYHTLLLPFFALVAATSTSPASHEPTAR